MKDTFDIYVSKADKTLTINFAALKPEVQEYIVAYGFTQTLGDAAANVKTGGLEGEKLDKARKVALEAVNKRLTALREGKVPAGGGGGAPLTEMVKALRHVVKQYMVANGWKAGDADKLVTKDPGIAFRMVLAKALQDADKPHGPTDVEASFEKNWPKVEAKARPIAEAAEAAKKATDEITL